MAGTFKIGTFNCQNLFSRFKVINRANHQVGDEKMAKIGLLRDELAREVYDSAKIIELYKEVVDFIEINEVRKKLFKEHNVKKGIFTLRVAGKKDWDGFIDFKPDKFDDVTRKNTAKVINTVNADIISLIEVEDKRTLDSFNSQLIDKPYPFSMLIDAFDDRRIDVALLSRFPFEDIRTHMFDKPKPNSKSRIFSRDCLEIKIKLEENNFVYLYINHLKSQGYGTQAGNDARRKAQAERVAEIINERELNLQKDKVIVLGDFNAPPLSPSLKPLMEIGDLKDVLALKIPDPKHRWTYYSGSRQQIDFILVSKPLQDNIGEVGIERRGIFNLKKGSLQNEEAWPSVQDNGAWAQASDHAAVWAEFSY